MIKLSTEQLLYLFYVFAYSDEDSITLGNIKRYLPKEFKNNADQICQELCQKDLLESPKKQRVSMTTQGKSILVKNLQTTDYQFKTNKGCKVVNALLECLKLAASENKATSETIEDMNFETFIEKFKELYFKQRKAQEMKGVVSISKTKIFQEFRKNYPLEESQLEQYFEQLKSEGIILSALGRNDELINWVE